MPKLEFRGQVNSVAMVVTPIKSKGKKKRVSVRVNRKASEPNKGGAKDSPRERTKRTALTRSVDESVR